MNRRSRVLAALGAAALLPGILTFTGGGTPAAALPAAPFVGPGQAPSGDGKNVPDSASCNGTGRWVKFTAGGIAATGTGNSGQPKMTNIWENTVIGAGQIIRVSQLRNDGSTLDLLFSGVWSGLANDNPFWVFPSTTASPVLGITTNNKNFSQFAVCAQDTAYLDVTKTWVGAAKNYEPTYNVDCSDNAFDFNGLTEATLETTPFLAGLTCTVTEVAVPANGWIEDPSPKTFTFAAPTYDNQGGSVPEIKALAFTNSKLTATKTAAATTTSTWSLTKTVDKPIINLAANQTGTATYTVTPTKTGTASVVAGTVTVPNLATGVAANITVLDPGALTCSGSATLTCPYSFAVVAAGTNTATVTYKGGPAGNIDTETTTASAPYAFPGTVVDATPSLSDIFDGDPSVTLAAPAVSGQAYTYTKVYACAPANGARSLAIGQSKTYLNTATLATATPLTATATVQVTCGDVVASKTATATYNEDFDWTLTKSVDRPAIGLSQGQGGTATYTVVATKTGPTITNIVVNGQVTVSNISNANVTVNSVTDTVGGVNATISNCTAALPALLAPKGTITCDYTAAVPGSAIPAANSAVWSTSNGNVSANVPVTLGAKVVNAGVVDLTDAFNGAAPVVLGATDVTKTFTYSHDFTCGFDTKGIDRVADGGTKAFPNIATMTSGRLFTRTANANVVVTCDLPPVIVPPQGPTVPAVTVPPLLLPPTTVAAPAAPPTAAPAAPTVPASVLAASVPTVPVSVLAEQVKQSAPAQPAFTGASSTLIALLGAIALTTGLLFTVSAAIARRPKP